MAKLSRILAAAARRLAADPRVRAKVSEVVENNIKPRAKEAWRQNKPKLEAKAAELNGQIRKKATRENLANLADKIRDRLRDRPRRS
jgi:hypothetical protein